MLLSLFCNLRHAGGVVDLYSFDSQFRQRGLQRIAGVDEAGRGPWAGPVVAAAVILAPETVIDGLNDSKKLTPLQRENLFPVITANALAFGVGIADQSIIDSINILQATFKAMKDAVAALSVTPDFILVDGSQIPAFGIERQAVIQGDAKSASIAAASIIAKVTRDRIMCEAAAHYPDYHFHKHKGYGTPEHQSALMKHGPCPLHRKSFAPVRACLRSRGNETA